MSDRTIPIESTYDTPTYKLRSEGQDITFTYDLLSLMVDWVINRVPTARVVLRDGSASEETFSASESDDLALSTRRTGTHGFDRSQAGADQVQRQQLFGRHSIQLRKPGQ